MGQGESRRDGEEEEGGAFGTGGGISSGSGSPHSSSSGGSSGTSADLSFVDVLKNSNSGRWMERSVTVEPPMDQVVDGTATEEAAAREPSSSWPQRRVAVIGGGVSGLAAAWHLSTATAAGEKDPNHAAYVVDVYERAARLGGHAWTVGCRPHNVDTTTTKVDIGFMVFNDTNYPNMIQWFQELGVATEPSDMSLSVSLQGSSGGGGGVFGSTPRVEWSSSGSGLWGLLATSKNPWTRLCQSVVFVRDLLRFHHTAADILALTTDDPRKHVTVQQYLKDHNYSTIFATIYLLPMMAALWSASLDNVLQFPACQLIAFLCHHQMLQIFHRPSWQTVTNRSETYVRAVEAALGGADRWHCQTPIHSIQQLENGKYRLYTASSSSSSPAPVGGGNESDDETNVYDHVIFACHAPVAQQILQRSHFLRDSDDDDDRSNHSSRARLLDLLGAVEYSDNVIYVHSDPTLMPIQKSCWASWNCLGKSTVLEQAAHRTHGDHAFMEGAESIATGGGRAKGNRDVVDTAEMEHLEGAEGRFKAVYVT